MGPGALGSYQAFLVQGYMVLPLFPDQLGREYEHGKILAVQYHLWYNFKWSEAKQSAS